MAPATCDGVKRSVTARDDEPLLYALTDGLKLKGPKFGCGLAQCGACTVLVNNTPVRSCVMPTGAVGGKAIRTLFVIGFQQRHNGRKLAGGSEQSGCFWGMLA